MDELQRTIGEVVRQRRRAQGMSLDVLASRAQCAKSYLSEIENDRRPGPPRAPFLRRLEDALALSRGTLTDIAAWARTPGPVLNHVKELELRDREARRIVKLMTQRLTTSQSRARRTRLDATRSVCASGELQTILDAIGAKQPEIVPRAEVGRWPSNVPGGIEYILPSKAPFLGTSTPAPTNTRSTGDYVRLPSTKDADAFAARVEGGSMLPEYRDGDIVVFSPATEVRTGMDCFVRLKREGDAAFKRVYFQDTAECPGATPERVPAPGQRSDQNVAAARESNDQGAGSWIRLQPLNPRYAPRVVHRLEVEGLYPAVSITRLVR